MTKNLITLHAEVPATLTFIEAHDLIDRIERDLGDKYSAVVTIHMDPISEDNEETIRFKKIINDTIRAFTPEAEMHDFRILEHYGKRTISFDVEVPFGTNVPDDEMIKRISEAISAADSTVEISVCIDKKIY